MACAENFKSDYTRGSWNSGEFYFWSLFIFNDTKHMEPPRPTSPGKCRPFRAQKPFIIHAKSKRRYDSSNEVN